MKAHVIPSPALRVVQTTAPRDRAGAKPSVDPVACAQIAQNVERMLGGIVADADGAYHAAVRGGVERWLAGATPVRAASRLRLVWSAPAAGGAA